MLKDILRCYFTKYLGKQRVNSPQRNQVSYITVTESNVGQRLDNFLLSILKGLPKSRLYRIIRKGEVRVNKSRASIDLRLSLGDNVRVPPVQLTEPKQIAVPSIKLAERLEQAILYEDQHLMVVNKPAGLAVHGGSGISLGLIEALRQMRSELRFLELVHRLDKETSGCVMVAKSRKMLLHLHQALQTGKITKYYQALVTGEYRGAKQIEAPLLKFTLQSGERMVKVASEGKVAKTKVTVMKSFKNATLLRLQPITGRTHQLRVHCTHVGHPIIGCPKYGNEQVNQQARKLGFNRLFLHAEKLVIQLPDKRDHLTVTCPLPKLCHDYLSSLI